eukprot:c20205_g1_i1.p1 GENE.c20205_g1_i1~~c20205_g1_i1.p1  ORF type:complete len:147 (-),score=12.68 c20205_g1_i1:300-740(-)
MEPQGLDFDCLCNNYLPTPVCFASRFGHRKKRRRRRAQKVKSAVTVLGTEIAIRNSDLVWEISQKGSQAGSHKTLSSTSPTRIRTYGALHAQNNAREWTLHRTSIHDQALVSKQVIEAPRISNLPSIGPQVQMPHSSLQLRCSAPI